MSGSGKGLVDANWVLRYLPRSDELLFSKASAVLEKAKTGDEKVIIPESVFTECIYVLIKVYEVDRSIVAEKCRDLLNYKGIVNPDKKDLIDTLSLFGHTNLSIVDCILCARSRNHDLPLFTFDENLRKIRNKRVI